MINKVKSIQDWKQYYSSRDKKEKLCDFINIDDFRNTPHKLILSEIGNVIKQKRHQGKEPCVIEIGAGDSNILIDIAKRYDLKNEICGLDYLQEACLKLKKKSEKHSISINTICTDLFSPPPKMLGKFDIVLSFGVVEHFTDLKSVMKAISRYASKNGIIFTLIPNNKDGIYGWMMKRLNKKVYDAHVLYSKEDLRKAHESTNLEVLHCDYLVSSNFGILSWCFANKKHGITYWLYKQFTRISKVIWLLETNFGYMKPYPLFSPYIVCIARKKS